MADRMTPEQRHRCMVGNKGKNTRPEVLVRRYMFAKGLRYRIHVKGLPGSPDIVFPKYKTVVFVDGCFWHGHEGCRQYVLPKSNTDFWQTKIDRNRARDLRNDEELEKLGWRVLRFWECNLKPKDAALINLHHLYLDIIGRSSENHEKHGADHGVPDTGAPMIAAEAEAGYGKESKQRNFNLIKNNGPLHSDPPL